VVGVAADRRVAVEVLSVLVGLPDALFGGGDPLGEEGMVSAAPVS
jgi:hypothetical protein